MVDATELRIGGLRGLTQRRLQEEQERRTAEQVRLQEQQARADISQQAYLREQRAYEAAKAILEGRSQIQPESPVGTHRWLRKLWTAGVGATGVGAAALQPQPGVYQLPSGELMSIDPRIAEPPPGAVQIGPPGYIPPKEIRPEMVTPPSPAQQQLYEAMGLVGVTTPLGVRFEPPTGVPPLPVKIDVRERLAERFPFYAKIREKARVAAEFLEKRIPRPELREGEIVYGIRGKIVGRTLPYGMTPFSRGVDWFKVVEGKIVPIERPDTAVGAISEAFYGVAGLPLPVEFGPEIEITPELYDVPGQIALMQFLSVGLGRMKAGKVKGKVKLKSVKKAGKKTVEKVANTLERIMKGSRTRAEAERNLAKAMKVYKDAATRAGVDKSIIDSNLREMMEFSQARGFFYEVPKPPIVPPEEIVTLVGIPPVEVPVTKLAAGVYAGLGIYDVPTKVYEERLAREELLRGKPLEDYGKVRPEFKPAVAEVSKLFIKPEPKFRELTALGVAAVTAPVEASKEVLLQRQKIAQEEILKERLRESQVSWTGLASIGALGLATPTIQKTKLRYGIPTIRIPKIPIPRIPVPKVPKIRIPPPLFDFGVTRRRRRRPVRRPRPLFIPEVRRRGKWIPITAPVPLFKAITIGKRKVERTLAASLRIRGPRGIVPLVPFGPKWRRAKKEPFVLIEKRKYRLDVPSEVSEILVAKKRKGKSKRRRVNFFS